MLAGWSFFAHLSSRFASLGTARSVTNAWGDILGFFVLEANFLLAGFEFTANESEQCALRSNEGSCILLCQELFNFDKPLPRTGGLSEGPPLLNALSRAQRGV